jgi:multiple sugar transport system permease protein
MTLFAPKPVLSSLVRSIFYVILAIWAFVCLFPFYWLAVTSLKDDRAIGEGPSFFPFVDFVPTLRAWSFVFGDPSGKIGPYLTNSMVVSLAATSLALLFGGMAVYGVTRLRPKLPLGSLALTLTAMVVGSLAAIAGAVEAQLLAGVVVIALIGLSIGIRDRGPRLDGRGLVVALLSTRLLPPVVVVLPLYVLMHAIGWLDTPVALAAACATANLPVAIWLLLPVLGPAASDPEEAALLDGASHLSIAFTILLPMVATGVTAVGLLIFVLCWNEYLFAAYLTTDGSMTMAPWVIAQISSREAQIGSDAQEWANLSAALLVMSIPLAALAAVAQRLAARMTAQTR